MHQVNLKISENTPLWRELSRRAPPSRWTEQARRDLLRYYTLLRLEEARLALAEAEENLLRDALNGVWLDETSWAYLALEIEDAVRLDALDRKWGVDGAALLARLHALCPGQLAALADAIERFWRRTSSLPETLDDTPPDPSA
jgi:hypothetical protein